MCVKQPLAHNQKFSCAANVRVTNCAVAGRRHSGNNHTGGSMIFFFRIYLWRVANFVNFCKNWLQHHWPNTTVETLLAPQRGRTGTMRPSQLWFKPSVQHGTVSAVCHGRGAGIFCCDSVSHAFLEKNPWFNSGPSVSFSQPSVFGFVHTWYLLTI